MMPTAGFNSGMIISIVNHVARYRKVHEFRPPTRIHVNNWIIMIACKISRRISLWKCSTTIDFLNSPPIFYHKKMHRETVGQGRNRNRFCCTKSPFNLWGIERTDKYNYWGILQTRCSQLTLNSLLISLLIDQLILFRQTVSPHVGLTTCRTNHQVIISFFGHHNSIFVFRRNHNKNLVKTIILSKAVLFVSQVTEKVAGWVTIKHFMAANIQKPQAKMFYSFDISQDVHE